MKWSVVCDSRYSDGIIAFAGKHGCTYRWTSDDPSIAESFSDKDSAEKIASGLRYNNPRVIPFDEMGAVLDEQFEMNQVIAGGEEY